METSILDGCEKGMKRTIQEPGPTWRNKLQSLGMLKRVLLLDHIIDGRCYRVIGNLGRVLFVWCWYGALTAWRKYENTEWLDATLRHPQDYRWYL